MPHGWRNIVVPPLHVGLKVVVMGSDEVFGAVRLWINRLVRKVLLLLSLFRPLTEEMRCCRVLV